MTNLPQTTSINRNEHDLLSHCDVVLAGGRHTSEEFEELVSPQAVCRLGSPTQEVRP